MNLLTDLFLTFARVGLFTFGGGYAMIALIEDACVEKKQWITHEEMMNVIVAAESTPGPIAINCATYAGYRQAGLKGAIAATVGMVLPSFLILYGISCFLDGFLEIRWVAKAFRGIRIAAGILILDAGIRMLRKMKKKVFPMTLAALSCAAMLAASALSLRLSSIVLLLLGACAGMAMYALKNGTGSGNRRAG